MTGQYVVGELSVLVATLQAVAGNDECAGQIARLRREAKADRRGISPMDPQRKPLTHGRDLCATHPWTPADQGPTSLVRGPSPRKA